MPFNQIENAVDGAVRSFVSDLSRTLHALDINLDDPRVLAAITDRVALLPLTATWLSDGVEATSRKHQRDAGSTRD